MTYQYDWEMGFRMVLPEYEQFKSGSPFGPDNLEDVEVSPNGYGPIRLSDDYAFLKMAVIRRAVSNGTLK